MIMVSFCTCVTAFVTILSVLGSARAIPLLDKLKTLSPPALNLLKTSTPAAPHFVAYNDLWLNPLPSASQLRGFNVFALSFLFASGPVDEAENWRELTASQRASYMNEYNSAGISLIVSAFGSTETPTSSGLSPTAAADTMAAWVIQYGLNGIDVDYEDFGAFNGGSGTAETWLISYTKRLRTHLPQGQYILTHAPVAPWFSPNVWSGGGYLAIHQGAGSLIDWYNVQFYNQGASEYTTCSGLLTASSSTWPQTALFQIAANGVPLSKLLIGKPGTGSDASNGYMTPSTLASCVAQAASRGWNGGVMVWQYPDATSSWITTVRGKTWPVSGLKTETPAGGNHAGVPTLVSDVQYTGGSQVTYDGYTWTANEWYEAKMSGREPIFPLPLEDQEMLMDQSAKGASGAWRNTLEGE